MENTLFDVIIVGGSYSGLSAAMSLGRSLRKVLILDSGKPCNATTPHSQNFLTQDGFTPAEITQTAKAQVLQYDSVIFKSALASSASQINGGFEVETAEGERFRSEKLVLATGIKDQLPEIPGLADCWGISVIHCPYCHGYEYRGKKTGLLAPAEKALHLAPMIRNLTDQLSIFTNGKADFNPDQLEVFKRKQIEVIDSPLKTVEHRDGYIRQVKLENGESRELDALYAAVPFQQHSHLPVTLGCLMTDAGHIEVDAFGETSVPGVFACGDNSSGMRSVANAVASGSMVGAMVNAKLCQAVF